MSNYLKDEINYHNRLGRYKERENIDSYLSDDDAIIPVFKVVVASVAIILGVGVFTTVKDMQNSKISIGDNTTIEEYNDDCIGTAVISMNGNATIVELESYRKTEDGSEIILTTTNGGNLIIDSDSVVVIDGENSHDVAYDLATTMIDENGQVTEFGKNKGPVKKLTL